MKKTIVLLPGDGIGPEVTKAAATVLRECAHEFTHQFEMQEFPIGGAAIAGGVVLWWTAPASVASVRVGGAAGRDMSGVVVRAAF